MEQTAPICTFHYMILTVKFIQGMIDRKMKFYTGAVGHRNNGIVEYSLHHLTISVFNVDKYKSDLINYYNDELIAKLCNSVMLTLWN